MGKKKRVTVRFEGKAAEDMFKMLHSPTVFGVPEDLVPETLQLLVNQFPKRRFFAIDGSMFDDGVTMIHTDRPLNPFEEGIVRDLYERLAEKHGGVCGCEDCSGSGAASSLGRSPHRA